MSKPSKRKNGKVPKITEEEYAAYLSALRASSETQTMRTQRANVNADRRETRSATDG